MPELSTYLPLSPYCDFKFTIKERSFWGSNLECFSSGVASGVPAWVLVCVDNGGLSVSLALSLWGLITSPTS